MMQISWACIIHASYRVQLLLAHHLARRSTEFDFILHSVENTQPWAARKFNSEKRKDARRKKVQLFTYCLIFD